MKKIENILENIKNGNYQLKLKTLLFFLIIFILSTIMILILNYFVIKKFVNWETIYYISQCINVIVALSIPFIIFSFQNNMEKNKSDEKINKLDLEDRIEKIERFITENQFIVTEKSEKIVTKNDVFKFISIEMSVTLKKIADHFDVDVEEIKPHVVELCLFDRLITTTLDTNVRDPENDSVWFRK